MYDAEVKICWNLSSYIKMPHYHSYMIYKTRTKSSNYLYFHKKIEFKSLYYIFE